MYETFNRYAYRLLFAAAIFTIGLGTVVYHLVEKFPWLDAYYFSVVTLTTVGYGDYTPHTTFGKLFTTFYLFIGIGIITTFITYSVRRRAHRYGKRQQAKENKQKIKTARRS